MPISSAAGRPFCALARSDRRAGARGIASGRPRGSRWLQRRRPGAPLEGPISVTVVEGDIDVGWIGRFLMGPSLSPGLTGAPLSCPARGPSGGLRPRRAPENGPRGSTSVLTAQSAPDRSPGLVDALSTVSPAAGRPVWHSRPGAGPIRPPGGVRGNASGHPRGARELLRRRPGAPRDRSSNGRRRLYRRRSNRAFPVCPQPVARIYGGASLLRGPRAGRRSTSPGKRRGRQSDRHRHPVRSGPKFGPERRPLGCLVSAGRPGVHSHPGGRIGPAARRGAGHRLRTPAGSERASSKTPRRPEGPIPLSRRRRRRRRGPIGRFLRPSLSPGFRGAPLSSGRPAGRRSTSLGERRGKDGPRGPVHLQS